jgi:membrane associated rhomboid family serine protease
MIPLRDDIPSQSTPVVNYTLIGLCAVIFLFQITDQQGQMITDFGMTPLRVTNPHAELVVRMQQPVQTPLGIQVVEERRELPPTRFHPVTTLLSCIFLHGSLMHLLGNMWFLYIFGDNVEDRLGKVGYLLFYLGSGVAASATHLLFELDSPVPTIGASGAVAGVMGAYMLMYPHGRVLTLVPLFVVLYTMVLPAPVFLGIWFIMQLFSGTFSMGATQATGVAWWAHIGGFIAGAAVAMFLGNRPKHSPKVVVIDPHDTHSQHRHR